MTIAPIYSLMCQNFLLFNKEKLKSLHLEQDEVLKVNVYLGYRGQTIKNQVKNLGVILETDLSFSNYVNARIRCFVSSQDLEKLFMPLSQTGWIIVMVSPAFQRRPLDSCSSSKTLLPGF